jgi:hypothetical protein
MVACMFSRLGSSNTMDKGEGKKILSPRLIVRGSVGARFWSSHLYLENKIRQAIVNADTLDIPPYTIVH